MIWMIWSSILGWRSSTGTMMKTIDARIQSASDGKILMPRKSPDKKKTYRAWGSQKLEHEEQEEEQSAQVQEVLAWHSAGSAGSARHLCKPQISIKFLHPKWQHIHSNKFTHPLPSTKKVSFTRNSCRKILIYPLPPIPVNYYI
jgi:hypothetical protein